MFTGDLEAMQKQASDDLLAMKAMLEKEVQEGRDHQVSRHLLYSHQRPLKLSSFISSLSSSVFLFTVCNESYDSVCYVVRSRLRRRNFVWRMRWLKK